MQLRYRGITYQPTNTQVETIPSDISARFLGRTYFISRSTQTFKPQLELKKYRGVTYIK